jgi:hypothetical protein
MGTSGSVDFTVTRNEIITAALRLVGAVADGDDPSSSQLSDAAQALNMIVKQWAGPSSIYLPGFQMWQRERASLTLTAKASFDLKASGGDLDIDPPVKILIATLKTSDGYETPLTPMLLPEYQSLADKSAEGDPTKYYYEKQLSEGTIYFDYVPSDTTKTVELTYLRLLEDFDEAANNPDFPQQFYRPLKFALAVDIAPEYDYPIERLGLLLQQSLELACFDPENINAYFQPGKD